MFWGMLFSNGMLFVRTVWSRAIKIPIFLSGFAVPTIGGIMGNDYILQQDVCSTHSVQSTMEFFENCGIGVLNWPSRSPDLCIIENAWSMLSDLLHDGTQPRNV